MRLYETTFIINPQADDAAIDRQVSAVTELIKNNQGEIVREERMGTRRLAYNIAGLAQGFYTSVIFKAPTEVLPVLERHFKLEEPYIRYLTIKYERDISKLDEERESRPMTDEDAPKRETEPEKKPAAEKPVVEKPAAPKEEAPAEEAAPAEPKTPSSDEEL